MSVVVNVKNKTADDIYLIDLGDQLIPRSGKWVNLLSSYVIHELQESTDLISAITVGDIAIQDSNQDERVGAEGIQVLMGLNGQVKSDDGKKQLVESTNLNIGYSYQFRSFGDVYDPDTDTWTVSSGDGLEGKFTPDNPDEDLITRYFWFSESAYISGGLLFGVDIPHGTVLNAVAVAPVGTDLGQGPITEITSVYDFARDVFINGTHPIDFYVDKAKQFPAGYGMRVTVQVPKPITTSSCWSAMLLLQQPAKF